MNINVCDIINEKKKKFQKSYIFEKMRLGRKPLYEWVKITFFFFEIQINYLHLILNVWYVSHVKKNNIGKHRLSHIKKA